jgi:hypothetical protein
MRVFFSGSLLLFMGLALRLSSDFPCTTVGKEGRYQVSTG